MKGCLIEVIFSVREVSEIVSKEKTSASPYTFHGGGFVSTVKEKLIKIIQDLDDDTAEKLLEEMDDFLLQLELENDPETLKAFEEAKKGKSLIPHDKAMKKLGL